MIMTTCTETYQPSGFSRPLERPQPVRCVREVDDQGRHRGRHQGWEPMPAGQRQYDRWEDGKRVTVVEPWEPWQRLWTWDLGGASGSSRKGPDYTCMGCKPGGHLIRHQPEDHVLTECGSCGALHDPVGYYRDDLPRDTDGMCFTCAIWEDRARVYALNEAIPDRRRGMHGRWGRPVRPHDDTLSGEPRLYGWSHGHGGGFGGMHFTVTWDDGQTAGPADYLWSSGTIPWWLLDRFPPNGVITSAAKVPRPGHTSRLGQPLKYTGHPHIPEKNA